MKLSIGIDPGMSGGIGFIPERGNAWSEKMPETLRDLCDLLETVSKSPDYEAVATLEKVHSMPGQGVSSSFKFGQGFGHLEMALTAAKIPFSYVSPQVWQKHMQCLTGGNKNISKQRAQQLFPHIKVTHAIADALLIAEYGKSKTQH